MTTAIQYLTITAEAFTGQGVRDHEVMVDNGNVLVWDRKAEHFTKCHSLPATEQAKIVADAQKYGR